MKFHSSYKGTLQAGSLNPTHIYPGKATYVTDLTAVNGATPKCLQEQGLKLFEIKTLLMSLCLPTLSGVLHKQAVCNLFHTSQLLGGHNETCSLSQKKRTCSPKSF